MRRWTVEGDRGEPYRDIAARLGLVEPTVARRLRREQAIENAGFRSVAIRLRVRMLP